MEQPPRVAAPLLPTRGVANRRMYPPNQLRAESTRPCRRWHAGRHRGAVHRVKEEPGADVH